jgi:hypothetical protein
VPADRDDELTRRTVVPDAAGRSLWLAAIWTGVGAAIVCATLAIVAVAICWLPVSGASGHSMSAVRAGLLTFLAALHGGITVDGVPARFVPLGLTLVVALAAWRAGSALGDTARSLDERDPARLAVAGAAQAASFTVACLVAVPFATLGTSSAPLIGVALAGLLLFAVTGGVAFIRSCALAEWVTQRIPAFSGPVLRAGVAGLAGYLAVGGLLVAGSLMVHAARVEALSREVGGGWGGVPVLLLGLLAAPNAVIAGAGYLAGPGFAVGAGTTVGPFATAHGVVPAFPILGALPQGHGATPLVWCLVVLTPVGSGICVARLAWRAESWLTRFRDVGLGAGLAGLGMLLLAWQAGGGIGDGRLRTVGASPWMTGVVVAGQLAVVASLALGLAAGTRWLRLPAVQDAAHAAHADGPSDESDGDGFSAPRLIVVARLAEDADEEGELAG